MSGKARGGLCQRAHDHRPWHRSTTDWPTAQKCVCKTGQRIGVGVLRNTAKDTKTPFVETIHDPTGLPAIPGNPSMTGHLKIIGNRSLRGVQSGVELAGEL